MTVQVNDSLVVRALLPSNLTARSREVWSQMVVAAIQVTSNVANTPRIVACPDVSQI